MRRMSPPRLHRGLTLIELLLFIVVIGIALAAVLQVFVTATRSSADPVLMRQQLAIAESVLREVTLMPFTWCDPDLAPNAGTAASAADCTVTEGSGPEGGQARTSSPYFNNVNDYAGFTAAGITDLAGQAVPGLAGYRVAVAVAQQALDTVPSDGSALKITVTVTAPDNSTVSLQGWRTRYAPNAVD